MASPVDVGSVEHYRSLLTIAERERNVAEVEVMQLNVLLERATGLLRGLSSAGWEVWKLFEEKGEAQRDLQLRELREFISLSSAFVEEHGRGR